MYDRVDWYLVLVKCGGGGRRRGIGFRLGRCYKLGFYRSVELEW